MKRSRHTQCDANPLCDGVTTKDILAAPTIASIAGYLEDIGLSKTASRAIARKILMRRPANDLPSSNYWSDVWDHINKTMHRDEQGNPTGWGLFWMHVHLARASARAALGQLRTPYDPGSYRKEKNGWRKDRDHQWKVELCGVDENTTAHVAVSVLNCAALMTRALEQQKPDIGAALHLTFHLSELNLELALRLSGIRQLVDIGVSVSEKGALDGGLDPAQEKRERFWQDYELQYVGPARSKALKPTAFAKQHWKAAGFPTAGAAQRFLSRRLVGER